VVKIGCNNRVLEELEEIEGLLEDPKTGLAEIKREIREIEAILGETSKVKGALTTGPLFIPEEGQHAVTVVVENLGRCPIDVKVKLLKLECCPPTEVDCEELECIKRCCAETAVLCAEEGAFEVVCCPEPPNASIRAFVAVHEDASPCSEAEFVVTAADMLPLTCPFCKKEKCRCRPCCPEPNGSGCGGPQVE